MTDIYGYAAAAPLYRAAGWMQVIFIKEHIFSSWIDGIIAPAIPKHFSTFQISMSVIPGNNLGKICRILRVRVCKYRNWHCQ